MTAARWTVSCRLCSWSDTVVGGQQIAADAWTAHHRAQHSERSVVRT